MAARCREWLSMMRSSSRERSYMKAIRYRLIVLSLPVPVLAVTAVTHRGEQRAKIPVHRRK